MNITKVTQISLLLSLFLSSQSLLHESRRKNPTKCREYYYIDWVRAYADYGYLKKLKIQNYSDLKLRYFWWMNECSQSNKRKLEVCPKYFEIFRKHKTNWGMVWDKAIKDFRYGEKLGFKKGTVYAHKYFFQEKCKKAPRWYDPYLCRSYTYLNWEKAYNSVEYSDKYGIYDVKRNHKWCLKYCYFSQKKRSGICSDYNKKIEKYSTNYVESRHKPKLAHILMSIHDLYGEFCWNNNKCADFKKKFTKHGNIDWHKAKKENPVYVKLYNEKKCAVQARISLCKGDISFWAHRFSEQNHAHALKYRNTYKESCKSPYDVDAKAIELARDKGFTYKLTLEVEERLSSSWIFDISNNSHLLQATRTSSKLLGRRDLTVNKTRLGNINKDYVAFFTFNKYTPLEYLCYHSTAICEFQVIQHPTDPGSKDVHVTFEMRKFQFPSTVMTGILWLCVGASNYIWKFSEHVYCEPWMKNKVDFITPTSEVMEDADLEISMLYMTKENYRAMREKGHFEVIVPHPYRTQYLYGFFFHPMKEYNCTYYYHDGKRRWNHELTPTPYFQNSNMFRFKAKLKHQNGTGSILYNVSCSADQYSVVEDKVYKKVISKSVLVRFLERPMISVNGRSKHEVSVYFSPYAKSGNVSIHVYTTSEITSFLLMRTDGSKKSRLIHTEFISHSLYEIIAKYLIVLSKLDAKVTGKYKLTITNRDKERVSSLITLKIRKALHISASPTELVVAEGQVANFDCLLTSSNPIKLLKDSGEDISLKEVRRKDFEGGVTFTFLNPKLEDSGKYICSSFNEYERASTKFKLAVWPQGSTYLSSEAETFTAEKTNTRRLPPGSRVLDWTDEEILREWRKNGGQHSDEDPSFSLLRFSNSLLGSVLATLFACIILALLVAGGICTYYRWWLVKNKDIKVDDENENETTPLMGRDSKKKSKETVAEDDDINLDEDMELFQEIDEDIKQGMMSQENMPEDFEQVDTKRKEDVDYLQEGVDYLEEGVDCLQEGVDCLQEDVDYLEDQDLNDEFEVVDDVHYLDEVLEDHNKVLDSVNDEDQTNDPPRKKKRNKPKRDQQKQKSQKKDKKVLKRIEKIGSKSKK